jgi:hypothetical protein
MFNLKSQRFHKLIEKKWSRNEDISKHLAKLQSQQLLTFCKEKISDFALSLFPPPSRLPVRLAKTSPINPMCPPPSRAVFFNLFCSRQPSGRKKILVAPLIGYWLVKHQ